MSARVLVVDDDPWILRMVTATLQKKDFIVDTAREGRQALERAQAQPPDVIISDVMMPVMDGWTFVQRLRAIPRLAAIPVIFLTALGKDEAKLRSLGMGPDDFLPKPFRFEELEKRVSRALKSNAQAAAHAMQQHPPRPTNQSGVHPMPGAPPNHQSGVHPMPGYPGQYPPGPPGGYPYGPGYGPGTAPGAGPAQGNPYPPQYPPGYPAPQYGGGYPGTQPGGYGPPPYAPYPNAQEPSKTPVRDIPQAPVAPPQAPVSRDPDPPEFSPDDRLPMPPDMPGTRRTTALNGRLEQLGLSSLLVMMEMERKDGVLSLRDAATGNVGRIFMRRGQVMCAKLDDTPDSGGKECVYTMLAWNAGTFSFSATRVDMEDTVNASTTHLLMEGARLIDEAGRPGEDSDGDWL